MVRNIGILSPLLLATVAVGLALVVGLWPSGQADASGHGATRSLSASSVAPGVEITVRINATNLADGFGQVVETLPAGFSYVPDSTNPSSIRTTVEGQDVEFTILGANQMFSYKVTASSTAGRHTFMGTVNDGSGISRDISDSVVTVTGGQEPTAGATRSLSASSVAPGVEITVRINATNLADGFGQVVETLPAGFSYVPDSTNPSSIRTTVEGQDVEFTILGANQMFSYKVTASSTAGRHTFMGTVNDGSGISRDISDSVVTVTGGQEPTAGATRSLSASSVAPGVEITVRINATNLADGFGQVVETLPAGFSYVPDSTNPSSIRTTVEGQDVEFTILGANQMFSYKVTASSTAGRHTFMGTVNDGSGISRDISDSVVTVTGGQGPPPRPAPRPAPPANNPPTFPSDMVTYTIEENSPPGTNVGAPVTAMDSDGDTLTYTLGGADMADFRIDSASGQITVGPDTSLDYESKSLYDDLAVMASDGNGGSDTASVVVEVTDVDEAPPADPCVNDLGRMETLTGTWAADCASENRLGRYANFFSFTLEEATEVTIDLTSAEDTYLYLLDGMGRDGMVLHENDDVAPGTNSQIQETLAAGTYTIEATTWGSGVTGSFTLTVSGLGDGTTPTPTPTPGPMPTDDPCRETLPGDETVTGEWASDCESAVGARGYARYYTFTLSEESEVTITLESDTDPYLYLRAGEAKSGDFLHENDDIVLVTNTNSRIEETLMAGTYTIEATTYGFGEMGSFTLTVSGLGDVTMPTPPQEPMPTDDLCRQTLSPDGPVTGQWTSDCESATRGSSYARFYTFTLTEASEVTITLESDTDPYLYLREGEAKSGDVVDENDDVAPGDTNSQIQGTLVAGTYTIEATTYGVGETGSFTLTVSGS